MKLSQKATLFLLFISISFNLFADIPVGYYHLADGKRKAELKTALSTIISNANVYSYGGGEANSTWAGFYVTDRNTSDNSVVDRYSNTKRYFSDEVSSVSGMHIEHSLPKSWWGSIVNNAYCDLHHLFPADGSANSSKNNLPLGIVTDPTFDNGVSKTGPNVYSSAYVGRSFEPADRYKGDFARAYMYVSTAYESFSELWNSPMMDNNTYPVWKPWAIDLLLEWHNADPVSDEERTRMEKVYGIQGNRNPFIDYPELANYIWGSDTANVYHFPTETSPYLVYPNRWTSVDFGVVLNNVKQNFTMDVLGVNLTTSLSLSLRRGNKGFSLSNTSLSAASVIAGAVVNIEFISATSGVFVDTLVVSGGGVSESILVPLKVVVSSEFLVLDPSNIRSTSVNLNWMREASAGDYLVDLYQGNTAAGDLFFSAYIEGSSNNKAIEIYNATGQTVDLSKYTLRKQNNGVGEFAFEYQLTGTLANKSSFIIVNSSAGTDLKAYANATLSSSSSIMAFNGNDAIALYREGAMIDIIGYVDNAAMWGENVTLTRKSSVLFPNNTFAMDEWDTSAIDTYTVLNNHTVTLDSKVNYILRQQSVGNVTTYHVTGLKPSSSYSYRVYAKNKTTSATTLSKNVKNLQTLPLSAPLSLEATDVDEDRFNANWEDDSEVDGFKLTIFQLSGNGEQTEKEEFSSVGTSGTPLPDGWLGTVSGSYTTAANSGSNPPSVAFKNNNETLQTKTFSSPITKLSFMYKYVSGGSGSNLKVEGLYNTTWRTVATIDWTNNTKSTTSYIFSTSDKVKALRFTYNKSAGNLALDDVEITYGSADTTYILHDFTVNDDTYQIWGLDKNTTYYYTVRSFVDDVLSPFSEVIPVTTLAESLHTDLLVIDADSYVIYSVGRKLIVESSPLPIVIYNLMGSTLYSTLSSHLEWNAPCEGIYILRIGDNTHKLVIK